MFSTAQHCMEHSQCTLIWSIRLKTWKEGSGSDVKEEIRGDRWNRREEGVIDGGVDGAIIGIMIQRKTEKRDRQAGRQAGRQDEGFDKSE